MITIVQTIIWDLDGTLLDTLADLTDGVNAGLKAYNMPLRTLDEVRHFVGNGVGKLIDRATPADRPCGIRYSSFSEHTIKLTVATKPSRTQASLPY